MTTRLTPVGRDDVIPLLELQVGPEQADFVASNAKSLAQLSFETGGYAFVIWDGDTRIGLAQVIDMAEHDDVAEGEDPDSVFLWRFMIDRTHQGQGHGRAALAWLQDWTRARGRTAMMTSAVPENTVALRLYEAVGFVRTGQMTEGDEVEMHMPL